MKTCACHGDSDVDVEIENATREDARAPWLRDAADNDEVLVDEVGCTIDALSSLTLRELFAKTDRH